MIIKEEFEIKINNLSKALDSLKESIILEKKNTEKNIFSIFRDSAIQRFEYTYELSWKFMKYILEKYDKEIETRSPRQTLKTAFRVGYIDNLNLWFNISEYRNKTSHEYEQDIADELFDNIPEFLEEIQKFYESIKIKYDGWYFETNK